jgi:hypothetical protein
VDVHVVVDGPVADPYMKGSAAKFYSWDEIPEWIPRKTDMIRSWGIYQAWKADSKYTLTLDDDVLPRGDIFEAYEEVFDAGAVCSRYLDVGALTTFPGQLRGFPFRDRNLAEVAVQYGGWDGVLDYDAPTQLAKTPHGHHLFQKMVLPVPRGVPVTTCIMNAAWRTKYAPIMWQLPLFQGRYNRFGDIWSGLFQKKVLDALGKVMVINGKASVAHKRASDPHQNLLKERPGIPVNEKVWDRIGEIPLADNQLMAYKWVTGAFAGHGVDLAYAQHFLKARDEWLALF